VFETAAPPLTTIVKGTTTMAETNISPDTTTRQSMYPN